MTSGPLRAAVFGVPVNLEPRHLNRETIAHIQALLTDVARPNSDERSNSEAADLIVSRLQGKLVLRRTEDQRVVANSRSTSYFDGALLAQVLKVALDHDTGRAHLHAAAVTADRAATIIVGPSGSGKSTLTAGLVKDGWGYLSDECLAFDGLSVHGYAKPISISAQVAAELGAETPFTGGEKVHVTASSIGYVTPAAPINTIVAVHFDPAGPPCAVSELNVPSMVHRLILECVDAHRFGDRILQTLVDAAAACANYLVSGSDLRSMVLAVRELDRSPRSVQAPMTFSVPIGGSPFAIAAIDGGLVAIRADGQRAWSSALVRRPANETQARSRGRLEEAPRRLPDLRFQSRHPKDRTPRT